MSSVREPRWTRPALVPWRRPFRVVIETPLSANAGLVLSRDGEIAALEVRGKTVLTEGFVAYTCSIPDGLPEQLYDLVLMDDGDRHVSPNAVYALPGFRETFTFLHASDLHLLVGGSDGTLEDRSPRGRALVERINAIRPDFVVYTGDLISRYGAQKEALSPEVIHWQARRLQNIMLKLKVPLFITIGNHDVAFESSRAAWQTYMGRPWDRATDDYSFDYGPCHFAVLDCFAYYDADNRSIGKSLTSEQCLWLERDMRRAASSQRRFLFIHYDYQKQLPALFDTLRLDMLFYGHSGRRYSEELERHGISDGHLSSGDAYRLVHVTPAGISSEIVSWVELMKKGSLDFVT